MLTVDKLNKTYPGFALRDVSFSLPEGYIMGFIGMNGAGKSTTLKAILNIVRPDSGRVEIFGQDIRGNELALKQSVGFSLGSFDYYQKYRLRRVTASYRPFYEQWDQAVYERCVKRFGLDEDKRVCELSQGMKVKYALALALSHRARLFLFDEPTSGLDPLARDDILDIFQELVEDGTRSILFSTHITSDLDKCADFIVFIRNGKIIANATKDDLIAAHALIGGTREALTDSLRGRAVSCKVHAHGFKGLILRADLRPEDRVEVEVPNLEDIMVYYNKEELAE